jgi:membrane-associated phospholipid phosphatase
VTTMDKVKAALQAPSNAFVQSVGGSVRTSAMWLQRKPRAMPPLPHAWSPREQGIAIALFLIGAAVFSMFFADGAATINSKRLPHMLVEVSNWLSDFGKSQWFLWPAAFVLAACALAGTSNALTRTQHRVLAAIAVRAQFVFIAVAVPGLVTQIVKRIVGRARPLVIDWHIPHPFIYKPFTNNGDFNSLPSGHATGAVSAAIVLGALWPRARPYLWVYAIYICVTRVIGLSHHVSDVLIGALIGAGCAVLIRNAYAARGLIFHHDEFGRIVPKPGPAWRRIKALARAIRGP